MVNATDLNPKIKLQFDICYLRVRRFESCRRRFLRHHPIPSRSGQSCTFFLAPDPGLVRGCGSALSPWNIEKVTYRDPVFEAVDLVSLMCAFQRAGARQNQVKLVEQIEG